MERHEAEQFQSPPNDPMAYYSEDNVAPAAGTAGHDDLQMPGGNRDIDIAGWAPGGNFDSGNPSFWEVEEAWADSGAFSELDDAPPPPPPLPEPVAPRAAPTQASSQVLADPVPPVKWGAHGATTQLAKAPVAVEPGSGAVSPQDVDEGPVGRARWEDAPPGARKSAGAIILAPEQPLAEPKPATGMKNVILKARKSPGAQLLRGRFELTGVTVRKMPDKERYHRVRPDDDPHYFTLLHRKEKFDIEYFLVVGEELEIQLRDDPYVSKSIADYRLALIVDTEGNYGWWAVPALREDAWADSARMICKRMESEWARIQALAGNYGILVAEDDLGAPVWPQLDDPTLLEKAFKDRIITDLDHPVLKKLKGKK